MEVVNFSSIPKSTGRIPVLLRCVCYAYLNGKDLATKVRNLSKRDELELIQSTIVDQQIKLSLKISNTNNERFKASKYFLKLATKVDIAIETFSQADQKLMDFVIEHYQPKLTSNLLIDFDGI